MMPIICSELLKDQLRFSTNAVHARIIEPSFPACCSKRVSTTVADFCILVSFGVPKPGWSAPGIMLSIPEWPCPQVWLGFCVRNIFWGMIRNKFHACHAFGKFPYPSSETGGSRFSKTIWIIIWLEYHYWCVDGEYWSRNWERDASLSTSLHGA